MANKICKQDFLCSAEVRNSCTTVCFVSLILKFFNFWLGGIIWCLKPASLIEHIPISTDNIRSNNYNYKRLLPRHIWKWDESYESSLNIHKYTHNFAGSLRNCPLTQLKSRTLGTEAAGMWLGVQEERKVSSTDITFIFIFLVTNTVGWQGNCSQ